MSNARFPFRTAEEVANFPSIKYGIDHEKELSYRQQASGLIRDLGERLQCTQCTMNTAIVYMHRFYSLNSFTKFHRNIMAPACLFLACKVEEQPRKVEHIIKAVYRTLFREKPLPELTSEEYLQMAEELVVNENILLQTLGFRIIVDHPHPHIVRYCDRELANYGQVSHHIAHVAWFLATNSLHLTTFCLQYPPTIIAALCIYLSCKYISYTLQSKSNQPWWYEIDHNATEELLTKLAHEFVTIMDKAPTKYKTLKGSKIGSETLLGGQAATRPGGSAISEELPVVQGVLPEKPTPEVRPAVSQEQPDDKGKEPEKSQRSIATTDDELCSPPRKQAKLNIKEYKARKITLEQNTCGESPLGDPKALAKGSSPQITVSSSEQNVPASWKNPPLEPLTLSQSEQRLTDDMKTAESQAKLRSSAEANRSGAHNRDSSKGDGSRHRNHHQHHHHRSHHSKPPGEEKEASVGHQVNRDKHHRHHHRPGHHHHHHHRHPRPSSSEKPGNLESAIKTDSKQQHSEKSNTNGNSCTEVHNGQTERESDSSTLAAATTVLPTKSFDITSKEASLGECGPEGGYLSACQTLLATPPSPTSIQHQELMEGVESEAAGDVKSSASNADCSQPIA